MCISMYYYTIKCIKIHLNHKCHNQKALQCLQSIQMLIHMQLNAHLNDSAFISKHYYVRYLTSIHMYANAFNGCPESCDIK